MRDTDHLTVHQLAIELGCAVSTVQRWRSHGVYGVRLLPQRAIGVRVWFTLDGVAAWQAEVDAAKIDRHRRLTVDPRLDELRRKREAAAANAEIRRREEMRRLR